VRRDGERQRWCMGCAPHLVQDLGHVEKGNTRATIRCGRAWRCRDVGGDRGGDRDLRGVVEICSAIAGEMGMQPRMVKVEGVGSLGTHGGWRLGVLRRGEGRK